MKVYLEFTSKNDGRAYNIEFGDIKTYLKYSKPFRAVRSTVSINENMITIKLNEPIYHTGDYTNIRKPVPLPRFVPQK